MCRTQVSTYRSTARLAYYTQRLWLLLSYSMTPLQRCVLLLVFITISTVTVMLMLPTIHDVQVSYYDRLRLETVLLHLSVNSNYKKVCCRSGAVLDSKIRAWPRGCPVTFPSSTLLLSFPFSSPLIPCLSSPALFFPPFPSPRLYLPSPPRPLN